MSMSVETSTAISNLNNHCQLQATTTTAPRQRSRSSALPRKRSKVSRACDECQRKKTRCDLISHSPPTCSACARAGEPCVFSRVPMKRGPSKGYIRDLEDRLSSLESPATQSDSSSPPARRRKAGSAVPKQSRKKVMIDNSPSSYSEPAKETSSLGPFSSSDESEIAITFEDDLTRGGGAINQTSPIVTLNNNNNNSNNNPANFSESDLFSINRGRRLSNVDPSLIRQTMSIDNASCMPLPPISELPHTSTEPSTATVTTGNNSSSNNSSSSRPSSAASNQSINVANPTLSLGQRRLSMADTAASIATPPPQFWKVPYNGVERRTSLKTESHQQQQQQPPPPPLALPESSAFVKPSASSSLGGLERSFVGIETSMPSQWALDMYYEKLHPCAPFLPNSRNILLNKLASAPQQVRSYFTSCIQTYIQNFASFDRRPRASKHTPSYGLAQQALTNLTCQLDERESFNASLLICQGLILEALEASRHGLLSLYPGDYCKGSLLGCALGMVRALTRCMQGSVGIDQDPDSDAGLVRRAYLSICLLDRWFAVAVGQPLDVPTYSVTLTQFDFTLLGREAYELMRITLIMGRIYETLLLQDRSFDPNLLPQQLCLSEIDEFRRDVEMFWDSHLILQLAYWHVQLLSIRFCVGQQLVYPPLSAKQQQQQHPEQIMSKQMDAWILLGPALRIAGILSMPLTRVSPFNKHFAVLSGLTLCDLASNPEIRDAVVPGLLCLVDLVKNRKPNSLLFDELQHGDSGDVFKSVSLGMSWIGRLCVYMDNKLGAQSNASKTGREYQGMEGLEHLAYVAAEMKDSYDMVQKQATQFSTISSPFSTATIVANTNRQSTPKAGPLENGVWQKERWWEQLEDDSRMIQTRGYFGCLA